MSLGVVVFGDLLRPIFNTTALRRGWLLAVCLGIVSVAAADFLQLQPAALEYTGTRNLTAADPNLTGEGVLIAAVCRSMTYVNNRPQNDYRFNMNHDCLYQGDVAFEDGSDGRFSISSHATAVAGMLIGQKDNAEHPDFGTFNYRGVCPKASVDVYEFRRFETLYLFDKKPFEADIITLSLGEAYEDWWTRALDNLAVDKDRIVVASIGNGAGTYDLLYPGAGANAIGVGVIDAVVDENGQVSLREFAAPTPGHTSCGPTDNHRCKPDLVAPGTALVPMHNNLTDYRAEANWSSLAAPIASGNIALLLQKAYTDTTISTDFDKPGKNALVKAVLLNSAAKLPYWHKGDLTSDDDTAAPLDYTQGAGALDAEQAMIQLTAGKQKPGTVNPIGWDNRILNENKNSIEYSLPAAEPNQMLTATLCWNRYYKDDYPFAHDLKKDTDLRLELWGITETSDEDILLDFSDSVNDNVEHIYFQCVEGLTGYRLVVRFNDEQEITPTTRQRYAVAWSIGVDTAADNPWWYDINGDNHIDNLDHLAFQLVDYKITNQLDEVFAQQALNLSTKRIALLESNWPTWKTYLPNYQIPAIETP